RVRRALPLTTRPSCVRRSSVFTMLTIRVKSKVSYISNTGDIHRSRLHVALIEPEIPPNTGNIARLCAATFTPLHLVGKLGFRTDDKAVRRAGLDYWKEVDIHYHLNIEALYSSLEDSRFLYFTTKAERSYTSFEYAPGD